MLIAIRLYKPNKESGAKEKPRPHGKFLRKPRLITKVGIWGSEKKILGVKDVFTCEIAGYAMSERMTQDMTGRALLTKTGKSGRPRKIAGKCP